MSVIGPRPGLWNQDVLTAERDKYGANDVKPGLTGWAQINGRDELEIPVKAKLIYYDMKLKFMSPTINLSFDMNDYVKLLENLEWYMDQNIEKYEDERFDYPTGMLGDIEIRFNHYKTFKQMLEDPFMNKLYAAYQSCLPK